MSRQDQEQGTSFLCSQAKAGLANFHQDWPKRNSFPSDSLHGLQQILSVENMFLFAYTRLLLKHLIKNTKHTIQVKKAFRMTVQEDYLNGSTYISFRERYGTLIITQNWEQQIMFR